MSSADGVLVLCEVALKFVWITRLYGCHSRPVQPFNALVDGALTRVDAGVVGLRRRARGIGRAPSACRGSSTTIEIPSHACVAPCPSRPTHQLSTVPSVLEPNPPMTEVGRYREEVAGIRQIWRQDLAVRQLAAEVVDVNTCGQCEETETHVSPPTPLLSQPSSVDQGNC